MLRSRLLLLGAAGRATSPPVASSTDSDCLLPLRHSLVMWLEPSFCRCFERLTIFDGDAAVLDGSADKSIDVDVDAAFG